MNSDTNIQVRVERLGLYAMLVISLGVAIYMGTLVGQGQFSKVAIVLFSMVGMTVGLWMGDKVWLVVPVIFSFDFPAFPLGGRSVELTELGMVAMTVVLLVRFATRVQKMHIFRSEHTALLLYCAWAVVIFVMNPVGMAIMGAGSVGARFYFKIGLALIAFIICANQKVTERDSRFIIWCMILGSFVSAGTSILHEVVFSSPIDTIQTSDADGYYTWQQALAVPPFMIVLWLVSRYKLSDVFSFSRIFLTPLLMLCVAVTFASGKRTIFLATLGLPILVACIRKEYRYIVMGTIVCCVLIFALVAGQRTLFNLPLTMQRTLANLPGDWDAQVKGEFGGEVDPFRDTMRELAWSKIRKDPIVATGFGINVREFNETTMVQNQDRNMLYIVQLAMGSSWHNTWLGIWADLGLPAVVFWAAFWIQAVVVGSWVYKHAPVGSSQRVLGMMCLLFFLVQILRSWTSGHSALGPFGTWWMYGLLVSLKYSISSEPSVATRPQISSLPRPARRELGRALAK